MLIKGYFYELTRAFKWSPFQGPISARSDWGYSTVGMYRGWSLTILYED